MEEERARQRSRETFSLSLGYLQGDAINEVRGRGRRSRFGREYDEYRWRRTDFELRMDHPAGQAQEAASELGLEFWREDKIND